MNMYSLYEASDMLRVSVPVLRREIYRNKLVGYKIGGRVYVTDTDLVAYLKSCATQPVETDGPVQRLFQEVDNDG